MVWNVADDKREDTYIQKWRENDQLERKWENKDFSGIVGP